MFSLFPEKTGNNRFAPKWENHKNLLPAALCGLAESKEKC